MFRLFRSKAADTTVASARPSAKPFDQVHRALDTLDADARKRCDCRAVARIEQIRFMFTHECMRAGR